MLSDKFLSFPFFRPEPNPIWDNLQNYTGPAIKILDNVSDALMIIGGLGAMSRGSIALYKGNVKPGILFITSGLACITASFFNLKLDSYKPYITPVTPLAPICIGSVGLYHGKKKKTNAALIISGIAAASLINYSQNNVSKIYQDKYFATLDELFFNKNKTKFAGATLFAIIGVQILMNLRRY